MADLYSISRGSSAQNATIEFDGATAAGAEGAGGVFSDTATAASSVIVINGSAVTGQFSRAGLLFRDSSNAGSSTITVNGGGDASTGGQVTFRDTASGGTARMIVNQGGKFVMGFDPEAGMSIGSLEGAGKFEISGTLVVGTNNLSTTVSGSIAQLDFRAGSLEKVGTGTLTLAGSNTFIGSTTVSDGMLAVTADGALGGTVGVTLETETRLTLSGGVSNDYIADAAFLSVNGTALVDLDFVGSDQISALFLNGIEQVSGTWGALNSGADHTSEFFTGSGMLTVVPEPGTVALICIGLIAIFGLRRKSAAA